MTADFYVGDFSNKWVVALPESEIGFETKQAAEEFIAYLKQHFPDSHFVLYPPEEKKH